MVYLSIKTLNPHPDNPRKDLGDLTELVESIKANGILQNLTVVPWIGEVTGEPLENVYKVVIGHRRLAAAKLAGLTELPCVIADMDLRTQVSTMMVENMQRNDLTVYEQAQGFQMMLNMGHTEEEISQKTGFSKTTVRHRVKLLELDPEKFKDSTERGATLEDYAKLEKIQNVKTRNKLLQVIGTSNFNHRFNMELRDQERKKNKPQMIKMLKSFATQVKDSSQARGEYIAHYDFEDGVSTIKKPKDAGKREYIFYDNGYGSVTLYGKVASSKKAETKAEREERIRKKNRKDITKQIFELREQFVREYSGAKKDLPVILEFLMWSVIEGGYIEKKVLFGMLGSLDENDDYRFAASYEKAKAILQKRPEKTLLTLAWCRTGDDKNTGYFDWNGDHRAEGKLNEIYKCLELLGYQMSDEEKALRDGTHALFRKNAATAQAS